MTPPVNSDRYKHHRFPGEIISHGVWLYYRFTLRACLKSGLHDNMGPLET